MKWLDWRLDVALLIFLGCLLKQSIFGEVSWPLPLCVCLLAILREVRKAIPERRSLAEEQYQVLHQRIDQVATQVGRLELANGLKPKGRTDA